VAEVGNRLVWSRVVGRKRRCKEGRKERKSWGLGCSEHVGADGMAGGRFPLEGKRTCCSRRRAVLECRTWLVPGAVARCLAVPS